jgi:hypothetical protein
MKKKVFFFSRDKKKNQNEDAHKGVQKSYFQNRNPSMQQLKEESTKYNNLRRRPSSSTERQSDPNHSLVHCVHSFSSSYFLLRK